MQVILGLLTLCSISVSAQFITAPTPTLANVLTAHTESSVGEIPLPTVVAAEGDIVEADIEAKQTPHTESSVGELPLPTVLADTHIDAKQTPHTEHSVGELPVPTLIGRKRAPKGERREAFRG